MDPDLVNAINGEMPEPDSSGTSNGVAEMEQVNNAPPADHSNEELDRANENEVEQQIGMEPEENFDLSLPASHSYLPNMVTVAGHTVMEAGWEGKIMCLQHKSIVFPGECIPMVCNQPADREALQTVIQTNKLFGLLCPDFSEMEIYQYYGVLCEIYEATEANNAQDSLPWSLSFKSRARHRFRLTDRAPQQHSHSRYDNLKIFYCNIKILPDVVLSDPLLSCGSRSLDKWRSKDNYKSKNLIRRVDASFTAWPLFLYETLNVDRMIKAIRHFFTSLGFELLPNDVISLSYWVASNLSLTLSEKLFLFTIDNAVLRLHKEIEHIVKYQDMTVKCCATCFIEITNLVHLLAMTNEGLRSNFCNPGGYIHGIMTVTKAINVALYGLPSNEFSWFPGYEWTICICGGCGSHIGWRFDAIRSTLRPATFWGLGENFLTSRRSRQGRD